jgi:hypothetical protein
MSRQLAIRASDQPTIIGVIYFFVAIGSMLRPRWLPQKRLPPYAYLPGKNPHPVLDRDGTLRTLFKGLILLSAAGVKIRERKDAAAARHAMRAAAQLRQLMEVPDCAFERALGMSPAALAECAEAAIRIPANLQATAPGQPQPVFNFILGPNSRGRPSGSQERNGHL